MDFNTFILYDLVVAAFLLVMIVLGAKRGLLRSVMSLLVLLLALFFAGRAAALLAQPVTDWVFPSVQQRIEEGFRREEPEEKQEKGILAGYLDNAVQGVTNRVEDEVTQAARQTVYSVVYALLFLLSFVILRFLLRFLTKLLNGVNKIPILRQINGLGGAAFGAVKGALLTFLLLYLNGLLKLIDLGAAEENTVILSFFMKNTPQSLVAAFMRLV